MIEQSGRVEAVRHRKRCCRSRRFREHMVSVGLSVTDVNKNAPPLSRAARANALLLVGMIGFGCIFAVYTYIRTPMTDVAGLPRDLVPLALMVFGSGMLSATLSAVAWRTGPWFVRCTSRWAPWEPRSACSCSRHATRSRRWSFARHSKPR